MQGSGQEATKSAGNWDPRRSLRRVDSQEVKLSKGFLRCRPERWFPNFPAHWLPIAHSLGVEIKIQEIKPYLSIPQGLQTGFACSVDDEPLGIFLNEGSTSVLLDTVVPGAVSAGAEIVAEYLARRLLVSLEASWSGPESSVVRFETEKSPFDFPVAGAVKIALEVHRQQVVIWIGLGKALVERLDGLWRRQLRSGTRIIETEGELHVEIAQIAVPPAMLVDYLKQGMMIDLEVPVSDTVSLKLGGKPWLPGRVVESEGNFAVEVLPGPVHNLSAPEGTTRISIVAASLSIEPPQAAEIGQVGAYTDLGVPVGDLVHLYINGEKAAEAKLGSHEGRFAITVL